MVGRMQERYNQVCIYVPYNSAVSTAPQTTAFVSFVGPPTSHHLLQMPTFPLGGSNDLHDISDGRQSPQDVVYVLNAVQNGEQGICPPIYRCETSDSREFACYTLLLWLSLRLRRTPDLPHHLDVHCAKKHVRFFAYATRSQRELREVFGKNSNIDIFGSLFLCLSSSSR